MRRHLLFVALLALSASAANADEIKGVSGEGGTASSRPSGTGTFGPDAFGYTGFDSTTAECGFQFVDISATGTEVVNGDDTGVAVALPGPAFNLYGSTFTQLAATTNGYLSTDPTDTGPDLSNDCPLPVAPSTGGGMRIYPLHDDLITSVRFQHFTSCPRPSGWGGDEGCYVFQWTGDHFGGAAGSAGTFQALLYTTSFGIVFQHGAGNVELGSGSTTGIQNAPPPTIGLNYACNSAGSIQASSAQCIYHPSFPFGAGAGADLAATLTAAPATVAPGLPITFSAATTNNGPGDAQDVQLTVALGAGVGFSSATPSAGGSCSTPAFGSGGSVVCTWAGATPSGTSRSVSVVGFSYNQGAAGATASASSATADPNPEDNSASASVSVSTGGGANPPAFIPTASTYGLAFLAVLLGLLGFAAVRRQH